MNATYTAGGIVSGPDRRIIVVNQNGNSWSLPKGHIDPGETALQAAVREIKEESGVSDLKLIKELGNYSRHRIGPDGSSESSELKNITIFLFRTDQTELVPEDADNPEARWVPIEEVADLLTHPKDKEFFKSVIPDIKPLLLQ